jgi:hypothetical protein
MAKGHAEIHFDIDQSGGIAQVSRRERPTDAG